METRRWKELPFFEASRAWPVWRSIWASVCWPNKNNPPTSTPHPGMRGKGTEKGYALSFTVVCLWWTLACYSLGSQASGQSVSKPKSDWSSSFQLKIKRLCFSSSLQFMPHRKQYLKFWIGINTNCEVLKKSHQFPILNGPVTVCELAQTRTDIINRKQHAKKNLPYNTSTKSSGRGSEKQEKQ